VLQTGATPTTAVTIDGSQQVGVGVTPSAWLSNRRAVEVGGGAAAVLALNGTAAVAEIFTNSYRNAAGTYIYSQTGYAGYMNYNNQAGGGWAWSLAPSGTAGNAITFTQAMTLDASGNLLVGTNTSGGKITVSATGNSGLTLRQNTSVDRFKLFVSDGSSSLTADDNYISSFNTDLHFMAGATGTTEIARLTSSGNLLVGQTTKSQTTVGFYAAATGEVSGALAASTSAATQWNTYSTGAGAYRFYVDMGGTVHATSVVITAISDERLKENVRDIDTGLSTVMALKPRRYDWKESKGLDKKNAAGFIAQEFEQVFPDSVGLSKAGEDGIEYKNINYEELIPTLTKAIQEQQAIIQAQAADIAALKAKVGI
jgi:hypothetical protein